MHCATYSVPVFCRATTRSKDKEQQVTLEVAGHEQKQLLLMLELNFHLEYCQFVVIGAIRLNHRFRLGKVVFVALLAVALAAATLRDWLGRSVASALRKLRLRRAHTNGRSANR